MHTEGFFRSRDRFNFHRVAAVSQVEIQGLKKKNLTLFGIWVRYDITANLSDNRPKQWPFGIVSHVDDVNHLKAYRSRDIPPV